MAAQRWVPHTGESEHYYIQPHGCSSYMSHRVKEFRPTHSDRRWIRIRKENKSVLSSTENGGSLQRSLGFMGKGQLCILTEFVAALTQEFTRIQNRGHSLKVISKFEVFFKNNIYLWSMSVWVVAYIWKQKEDFRDSVLSFSHMRLGD